MNKEEILRKSRNEKVDEGILNVLDRSYRQGIKWFCFIFVPLVIIALIKLRATELSLLMSIFYGFLGAFTSEYRKATNDKRTLFPKVLMFVSIIFFILYVRDVIFS